VKRNNEKYNRIKIILVE